MPSGGRWGRMASVTRDEGVQIAEQLCDYQSKSMVESGRVLASWVLAREHRLDVILHRATTSGGDPAHILQQLVAEVLA